METLFWPSTPFGPLWGELDDGGKLTAIHWGKPPAQASQNTKHPAYTALNNYFNKITQYIDIKCLNMKGTPFQQRVWEALLSIPYGEIRTYGQLAKTLNTSPRALGGAVGSNPVPILVPCHRVMGTNGKLTGFSAPGGVETKRWLLRHEGHVV